MKCEEGPRVRRANGRGALLQFAPFKASEEKGFDGEMAGPVVAARNLGRLGNWFTVITAVVLNAKRKLS